VNAKTDENKVKDVDEHTDQNGSNFHDYEQMGYPDDSTEKEKDVSPDTSMSGIWYGTDGTDTSKKIPLTSMGG
jgi:hypothetical protein